MPLHPGDYLRRVLCHVAPCGDCLESCYESITVSPAHLAAVSAWLALLLSTCTYTPARTFEQTKEFLHLPAAKSGRMCLPTFLPAVRRTGVPSEDCSKLAALTDPSVRAKASLLFRVFLSLQRKYDRRLRNPSPQTRQSIHTSHSSEEPNSTPVYRRSRSPLSQSTALSAGPPPYLQHLQWKLHTPRFPYPREIKLLSRSSIADAVQMTVGLTDSWCQCTVNLRRAYPSNYY
ncbi:hypothetical protein CRM22_010605 [Opisthorchis felineus]|uniref:Uncharacterized protein n=1 Tax=Opisthorchis felineus TaxID=147828 RepID=A0A4S2KRD4_OPIFE|nr:hypothetical protein CRM22_010605 [Opisthorchis felineus]